MKFNCVYTYWWRYLAGILNKQKLTAEGKLSLWFLRMARSFIIIVFCFVYIGETSHATSVCMSLSLPCTVMIFNIVGISQGYVTRNKRSDSSAVLRDAIIQPTQFSTTPTTSQNVQQQSQYHSTPITETLKRKRGRTSAPWVPSEPNTKIISWALERLAITCTMRSSIARTSLSIPVKSATF